MNLDVLLVPAYLVESFVDVLFDKIGRMIS